jgi:hypothetical protein
MTPLQRKIVEKIKQGFVTPTFEDSRGLIITFRGLENYLPNEDPQDIRDEICKLDGVVIVDSMQGSIAIPEKYFT